MAYSFFPHTADIGIDLHAPTLDRLFSDAALAFCDTITDPELVGSETIEEVELTASDPELLLVDWLDELLFRFDRDGFLPRASEVGVDTDGRAWRLHSTIRGERAAASRVPTKVLVKAVTYHELRVAQTPDGWEGRVILDI